MSSPTVFEGEVERGTEVVIKSMRPMAIGGRFVKDWVLIMGLVTGAISLGLGGVGWIADAIPPHFGVVAVGSAVTAGVAVLAHLLRVRRYLRHTTVEIRAEALRDWRFLSAPGWRHRTLSVGVGVGVILGSVSGALGSVSPGDRVAGSILVTVGVTIGLSVGAMVPAMFGFRRLLMRSWIQSGEAGVPAPLADGEGAGGDPGKPRVSSGGQGGQ